MIDRDLLERLYFHLVMIRSFFVVPLPAWYELGLWVVVALAHIPQESSHALIASALGTRRLLYRRGPSL